MTQGGPDCMSTCRVEHGTAILQGSMDWSESGSSMAVSACCWAYMVYLCWGRQYASLQALPLSFVPTLVWASVTVLCTTSVRSAIAEDLFSGVEKNPAVDEKAVSQPLLNITVSGRVGRRWEIAEESTMYIYNLGLLTIARSLIESTV